MMGMWTGTYRLTYLRNELHDGEPVPIYLFELDPLDPLTFITTDGVWQRPAQRFETDMGSVPPPLQGIAGPLGSPRGFPMHDSAFDNHGWWESTDHGATWTFAQKTEEQVNTMLLYWCGADGVDWFERNEIYLGVELGGSEMWNAHTGPFPADPPPKGSPT